MTLASGEFTTVAGDAVREKYRREGRSAEREFLIELIQGQICFDALADSDGRCGHHGGKCYELGRLVHDLKMGNK